MKIINHFNDFINYHLPLHPKLEKRFECYTNNINDLSNHIFYGPSGAGKYSLTLNLIKRYSPSCLKYEKKIGIVNNKTNFYFKISDIHFEIDMSLLGCNAKILWNTIFHHILDIVISRTDKSGIILCKNFQAIHNDLLDNFYNYMQKNNEYINIVFIIITKDYSFIPDNIISVCNLIRVPRPNKSAYKRCITNKVSVYTQNISDIKNIKNLIYNIPQNINPKYTVCDKIVTDIIDIQHLNYLSFREKLYDILIYNIDVTSCVWYILKQLISKKYIKLENIQNILLKTFVFLQYYNNNYRPIYHLENYMFYLIITIHELEKSEFGAKHKSSFYQDPFENRL